MTKDSLIKLLAWQIKYADSLNGKLGTEAMNERTFACDAANCTLAVLSQMGIYAKDAYEQAENIDLSSI